MDRWLRDRRVTITPADIATASQLVEGTVQDYLVQRNNNAGQRAERAPEREQTARSFDVAGLEETFDNLLASITRMPEDEQAAVAAGVAFAFRTFERLYPGDVESFVSQRSKVQQDFINMLSTSANEAANNAAAIKIHGKNLGREMATGIRLANMYFAALLSLSHEEWRTDAVYAMVDHLGERLTPLVKQGLVLLRS